MNLRRNALWNVAEVVATVLVQLIIFRVIIRHLGISALGIWSLVFSALAFARVADIGMAGGLVRFVARPSSELPDGTTHLSYVETGLIANFVLYTGLSLLTYVPIYYALSLAMQGASLGMARQLLPYAFVSFVILNLSGVTSSSLIGFKRSDIKSGLSIASLVVQLSISIVGIRQYGLIGLAVAQICQNLLLAVLGWFVVLRVAGNGLNWKLPTRVNKRAFKEMFSFGIRLQALNVMTMLYDPLTRFVFSAVAGPAALGFYETAYRPVFQARAVIVAPAWNLPPIFAGMLATDIGARRRLYFKSSAAVTLFALLTFGGVLLVSPVLSFILLRRVIPAYSVWMAILCAGWFFNIAGVPGFLMSLGRGRLKWNIAGAATSAFFSAVLGYILGSRWGGIGVVTSAAISIGIGGVICAAANCRAFGIERAVAPIADYWSVIVRARTEIWLISKSWKTLGMRLLQKQT